MSKKKNGTEEIIGNVKLVCHKYRWSGFQEDCGFLLSIQNCLNFTGPMEPCNCFEIQELDIQDRELVEIEKRIVETEDPDNIKKEKREVVLDDADEPPIGEVPKKKRRRRRKTKTEKSDS